MNRKVYVTNQTERSRQIFIAVGFCVLLIVAVLFYELGQSRAGFSRIQSMEDEAALAKENKELARENKEIREKLAILETSAAIDQEAYRKVEADLVDLQSKILAQQEDLEFYRGIVNENDGTGLRIQDFSVSQGIREREYNLRLVLAQAFRSTRQVSGQVELVVEGLRDGEAVRLKLSELAANKDSNNRMSYSFKYFQDLKAEVVIPADFAPERVLVIVHPSGKSSKTVEDVFVWNTKRG